MRNLLLLPAIALAACLLTSCYKYTTCPAFDGNLLDAWFPYQEDARHYFSSANGQTDTMVIGHINETDEYIIRHKGSLFGSRRRQCQVYGTIDANTEQPNWINMNIRHTISDDNGTESLTIRFRGMEIKLQPGQLQTLADAKHYRITMLDNTTLNGISYQELRLVEPLYTDVANEDGIDKLYIARGKGFIGYRTYPARTEYWIK